MDTKDTDKIVEGAAEKVKKSSRNSASVKKEEKSVEPEKIEVQIDEADFEDETLHLAYYDNHAITALILAVVSVVAPFLGFGLGGIVGLVLAVVALYQVRQSTRLFENSMTQTAKILAIIGIILSVIAIGITIAFWVSAAWHVNALYSPTRITYGPQHMTYYHRYFF